MKHIKTFNESQTHYFGPSQEDEKKASEISFKSGPFAKANSFKTAVSKYLLDEYIRKKFKGHITMKPGNLNRLTVHMKNMLKEEEINSILSKSIERFNIVYGTNIKVKEVKEDSFVLENEK